MAEVAPGHLKSVLSFIGFEKRMSNNEKAKDLFFRAFNQVIDAKDSQGVAVITIQYARFLAFKCNDVGRACDILDQAVATIRDSKVLFLSILNLLKHLEGCDKLQDFQSGKIKVNKVTLTYEKAVFESELSNRERKEVAYSYLEYLKENAHSIGQLKALEVRLREENLLLDVHPLQD